MADAFALASAAAERRKASAPRLMRAAALRYRQDGNACWCCAAMVGMRLSALRLPYIAGGEFIFWCVVVGRARTQSRREKDLCYPHPRSETERGRGTTRSVVEGACGAEAGREADAPSTASFRLAQLSAPCAHPRPLPARRRRGE